MCPSVQAAFFRPGSSSAPLPRQVLLPMSGAIAWLAFATVLIAFLSEKLTGAIEGTTATYGISETFVSFVKSLRSTKNFNFKTILK